MSTLTPGLKCGNKLTISCAIYRSCMIMTVCLFMYLGHRSESAHESDTLHVTPSTRCHNVTQCAPDDRVGSCFTRPSTLAVAQVLIYWHYGLIIIASHIIIVDIESNKCPWVTTAFTSAWKYFIVSPSLPRPPKLLFTSHWQGQIVYDRIKVKYANMKVNSKSEKFNAYRWILDWDSQQSGRHRTCRRLQRKILEWKPSL